MKGHLTLPLTHQITLTLPFIGNFGQIKRKIDILMIDLHFSPKILRVHGFICVTLDAEIRTIYSFRLNRPLASTEFNVKFNELFFFVVLCVTAPMTNNFVTELFGIHSMFDEMFGVDRSAATAAVVGCCCRFGYCCSCWCLLFRLLLL